MLILQINWMAAVAIRSVSLSAILILLIGNARNSRLFYWKYVCLYIQIDFLLQFIGVQELALLLHTIEW